MSDYVILGRVEQVGEHAFCATVSAIPTELTIPGATIDSKTVDSREEAMEFMKQAAVRLGSAVVTRGDSLVGLVPDDWEGWGP